MSRCGQAVVASLADVKSASATAALRKALEDAVPEVSFAAAKALWARHDPVGRAALLAVLAEESKSSSNFFSKAETRCPAHDAHAADHVPVCRAAGYWVRSAAWTGRRHCFHAGNPRQFGSPGTRIGGFTAGCRQGSRHDRRAQGCALRQGFVRPGRRSAFHQPAKRPCFEEGTGTAAAGRQWAGALACSRRLPEIVRDRGQGQDEEAFEPVPPPGAQEHKK